MTIKPVVQYWLLLGAILVFFQIFIGGVTRLTGSGLSITEWEIVTGTFPPMSDIAWSEAFELYKDTPQYEKINEGMSMSEFKFIYFWEYFHRLWARMMGLVFAIPLAFFVVRGWIPRRLTPRLIGMFLGAAVVAVFGWIMVASGLQDRPWVNAYKLSMHLGLALILYCYILYTWFLERFRANVFLKHSISRPATGWLITGLGIQIILGAWMSGMKAGLLYPTWPDMNGTAIPAILKDGSAWRWANVVNYDGLVTFMPALVQVAHRSLAYILFIAILWYGFKMWSRTEDRIIKLSLLLMVVVTIIQVLLGILTLINCVGNIPVGLGSAHQVVAIVLLSIVLFLFFAARHMPKGQKTVL